MILNPDAELLAFDYRALLEKQNEMKNVVVWGAKIIDENNRIIPSTFAFSGALKEIVKLSELNQHIPMQWKPSLSNAIGHLLGGSFASYADSFNKNPGKYDWVSGSAMIIKSGLLEGEYLFDPYYFLYYEDGDLCKRTKIAGYDVKQFGNLVVRHKTFGSSGYNSFYRLKSELESMVYYRKKWSAVPVRKIIGLACFIKSLALLFGWSLVRHEDAAALSRCYMQAAKALIR
jgi:GT2 family glycosyltransferase